ncbi:MAG: hypothetical protein QM755_24605 [Luteolibacter sp.]
MKRNDSRHDRYRFIGCLFVAIASTAFLAIQIARFLHDGWSFPGTASTPQPDSLGLGRGITYGGPLLGLILILITAIVCWVGVVDYLRNRRGKK